MVGKGENAGNQHFLLFPTMFSTVSRREIIILVTFVLSSANALNLVDSENWLCGKELRSLFPEHSLIDRHMTL